MAVSDLVNLSGLMDDAKCFAFVRQRRWPEGIRCPACDNDAVIRDGHDDTQPCRQRYRCKACSGRFDDLTGTVLAGHHQPLRVWVLCLYFMGLNLSNRQHGIAPVRWTPMTLLREVFAYAQVTSTLLT
jgi:transposase-like protein